MTYRPFNRRSTKKGVPGASTQQISDILPVVGRQLKLDKKVQEWAVLALWDQVVDEPFRGKSRAARIRSVGEENRLLVQAKTTTVAAELTFYTEKYQDKLNAYAPQTGIIIHRIEIRSGS